MTPEVRGDPTQVQLWATRQQVGRIRLEDLDADALTEQEAEGLLADLRRFRDWLIGRRSP